MIAVSVIIPVYNSEKYLRHCLDSVCSQTLSDIEIICINDCSSDGSVEIMRKYADEDSRITLINQKKNYGVSRARNAGIQVAKGKYIGFVDSDDRIDLNYYEELYSTAEKTGADMVNCRFTTGNFTSEDYSDYLQQKYVLLNSYLWSGIYKRSVITDKQILFDEQLRRTEDMLFKLEFLYHADKICSVNSVFYHYNKTNENSATHCYSAEDLGNSLLAIEKVLDFINKNPVGKNNYTFLAELWAKITVSTFYQFSVYGNFDSNTYIPQMKKILGKIYCDVPQLEFGKVENFNEFKNLFFKTNRELLFSAFREKIKRGIK